MSDQTTNSDANTHDASSRQVVIKITGLEKAYYKGGERLVVLRDLDLAICQGEIISIQGASGSGKSTLLNIIGAIDRFDEGDIQVAGTRLHQLSEQKLGVFRSQELGFIFQNHHLLPDFNLLENTAMPLFLQRVKRKEAREKARGLLRRVGLEHRLSHFPSQISGGESQRASIARALAGGAGIILADEPTGNLDSDNSDQVIQLLWDLQKELGFTMVMVTHDNSLAGRADRQFLLTEKKLSEIR